MKTATTALINWLAGNNQFLVCDLYTLSVPSVSWSGGFVVSYTDYYYSGTDYDVVYDGHTFSGQGLIIKRDRTKVTLGLEVDTLEMTVYASSSMTINGIPFLDAVRRGFIDGALLKLDKAFINYPTDQSIVGTVNLFNGRVAKTETTRTTANISVNSDLELLNVPFPRNIYQPSCQNSLYDGVCGLDRSTYALSGTVSSSTLSTVTMSGSPAALADGYYNQGVLLFTSGTLSGIARNIKSHALGVVTFSIPLNTLPSNGDSFIIYPGCDKTMVTCNSKFNNLLQFKGMPFVPVPETAV